MPPKSTNSKTNPFYDSTITDPSFGSFLPGYQDALEASALSVDEAIRNAKEANASNAPYKILQNKNKTVDFCMEVHQMLLTSARESAVKK